MRFISDVIGFFVGVFFVLLTVLVLWSGMKWLWYVELKGYAVVAPSMHVAQLQSINTYTVVGENMREEVRCEFDEPLKHLTLIMHDYPNNEEMYADYILLAEPVEHEEIWGWSNCVWQPEDNWAACDVYYVRPDYVHADMNIDTIGHEVTHGMCGDFHE